MEVFERFEKGLCYHPEIEYFYIFDMIIHYENI